MENKSYFRNLDAIRFIAAMMVVLSHGFSKAYLSLPIHDTFIERFIKTLSNGATGVSIFFILSGFLITWLLIKEHETSGKIKLKNFYMRRILRIWPLYFAVVAFTFIVYPVLKTAIHLNHPLSSNILMHLLFISNFDVIRMKALGITNHAMSQNITWSVSIEEQFYAIWPLLFVLIPKRYWITMVLIVITGSILFRILNYNDEVILYFHTISVMIDLGIGGLMALIISRYEKCRLLFEKSNTFSHLILFSVLLILLLWQREIFYFKYGLALSRLFISVVAAGIIASQAFTLNASKLNIGNWTFASKYGKYTYGIYLLHAIAFTLMDAGIRGLGIEKTGIISQFIPGIIAITITLWISKLSYKYYESRFLALKVHFSKS